MNSDRFQLAAGVFDALNAADERSIRVEGIEKPRSVVEAERLTHWILRLRPDASEALRLAARCQHLERWKRPRSDYPDGRTGYLQWRKDAARFHAERAAEVLVEAGYDHDFVSRVRAILMKRALKLDPETQAMEDALCLAFLELDFVDFSDRYPLEKVEDIVQKTWRKMSSEAREIALGLPLPPSAHAVIANALAKLE